MQYCGMIKYTMVHFNMLQCNTILFNITIYETRKYETVQEIQELHQALKMKDCRNYLTMFLN